MNPFESCFYLILSCQKNFFIDNSKHVSTLSFEALFFLNLHPILQIFPISFGNKFAKNNKVYF